MPRYPFTGEITDDFGPRESPGGTGSTNHLGLDGIGDGNFAPENGVLSSYGPTGGFGNLIIFLGQTGWWHYIAHNETGTLNIPIGTWVREGTRIATMGMTGTATGIHCHWETHRPGTVPGEAVDPQIWLAAATAAASLGSQPLPEVPAEVVVHPKDRIKKMYGFIRNAKTSSIAIVYGDGPNAGRKRALKNAEWRAFKAQGWKYEEVEAVFYDAIPDAA